MYSAVLQTKNARRVGLTVATFYLVILLINNLYYQFLNVDAGTEGWSLGVSISVFLHFAIPFLFLPILLKVSTTLPLLKKWYYVLMHLGFSLIYVVLFVFLLSFFRYAVEGFFFFDYSFESIFYQLNRQLLISGSSAFVTYWGIILLSGLQFYFAQITQIQNRSLKLEEQLSKATLSTLKAQLKPHFLFNTLNMVDFLIHTDHNKAVDTLSKLEDLIKSTFDKHQPNTCTIRSEIDFLEKYLEIEQSRFSDRLQVIYEISDETEPVRIPCYLVQPLVENSIKHAVGKMLDSCVITIRTKLLENELSIQVEDNGIPDKKSKEEVIWGVGLRNVDERLKLFYGPDARLEIGFLEQEGFKSHVLIPKKYLGL